MAGTATRRAFNTICTIVAIGALAGISVGMANAADDVTEGQILRALTPKKPLTRSLSMTPPAEQAAPSAETRFVDSLRNRTTRSLSSGERQQIAAVVKDKPNIDLEITFDYNSANISGKAQPAVEALGKALSNADLKGSTFLVAGHTDAVGSAASNQILSEDRAEALKWALVEEFGIPERALETVGYGEEYLLVPTEREEWRNRRVTLRRIDEFLR